MTATQHLTKRGRHDAILDAAALQLANFGVGTSSLSDIAASLGMTRSALYYYAKSKEDLVFQVYKRSCDILADTAALAASSSLAAPQKIAAFVRTITDRPQVDVIALGEVGLIEEEQRCEVLASYEDLVSKVAGIVRDGTARGQLRKCDPEIVGRTIISIVQQLCMINAWTRVQGTISPLGDEPMDFPRLVEGAVDLLWNGWAADRSEVVPLELIDLSPMVVRPSKAFDREGQARIKREEILITASRLFNLRGVSSTTLDDIAAELGATKRTIYHYAGDKQTLLALCHERSRNVVKYLSAERDRRIEAGLNPNAAYVNYLRSAALGFLRTDIAPIRAAVGIPELDERGQSAHREYVHWLRATNATIRGQLQKQGALRRHDGRAAHHIHIGGVNWLAKGLVLIEPERAHSVAVEVIDVLRLGLKPID